MTPEHTPKEVIGFLDATRLLSEDEAIILSRNSIKLVNDAGVRDSAPVHYEGLNYLSEIYQPIQAGTLVTDEFKAAAKALQATPDATPWTTYPLITVINHLDNTRFTETVNVARLIANDALPLYSYRARSTRGGEQVITGLDTLIKGMVDKIGINPVGAVIYGDGEAMTIRDSGLNARTHFDRYGPASFDQRGEAALSLIQMSVSQAFIESRYRITEASDGRVELVLRIGTQPDLQTTLLELIDLVESHHLHLRYTYDGIATGEMGSVFSVVDDKYDHVLDLTGERSLDMAVHNAYLAATELWNNLDR